MADKKVSALTAITNMSSDDLMMVVNDPSGTPASRKITHANFFANVATVSNFTSNVTISSTKATVSANTTFNGSVTYNGGITFSSGVTFANSTINVLGANTIVNGNLTANGALVLRSSVSSSGSNIIGSNGKINANNAITAGTITEAMMQTKPIANTTARTLISDRMQVANTTALVNDRMQVANTTTNFLSKTSEDTQITSANVVIDAGSTVSNTGVHISNGAINIFSDSGAPSLVDFYCEVTNQHKVRLQAPAHANFSGDVVVTLPVKSGNVATTNSEVFTGTTSAENLTVNSLFRLTNKVSDFATSNAVTESVTAGSVYYSNTYLYVVTDSNTIKRVLLSTW